MYYNNALIYIIFAHFKFLNRSRAITRTSFLAKNHNNLWSYYNIEIQTQFNVFFFNLNDALLNKQLNKSGFII